MLPPPVMPAEALEVKFRVPVLVSAPFTIIDPATRLNGVVAYEIFILPVVNMPPTLTEIGPATAKVPLLVKPPAPCTIWREEPEPPRLTFPLNTMPPLLVLEPITKLPAVTFDKVEPELITRASEFAVGCTDTVPELPASIAPVTVKEFAVILKAFFGVPNEMLLIATALLTPERKTLADVPDTPRFKGEPAIPTFVTAAAVPALTITEVEELGRSARLLIEILPVAVAVRLELSVCNDKRLPATAFRFISGALIKPLALKEEPAI